MPPIVVYISDSTPAGPVLDGRWVAFQQQWTSKGINSASGGAVSSTMDTVFKISALSFDDLGGNPFFNIDFDSNADAINFLNDLDYLAVGLSSNGEASATFDTIQANTPVYLDLSQGERTNNRITWSNTDTGVTTLFTNLASGDHTYLVAHSAGDQASTGIINISSTSLAPNINDTITLSFTSSGDDPDWVKWTITGVENTDWQFANGTNRYSTAPQITILTSTSLTIDQDSRWEGTSTTSTTFTEFSSTNTLTINPVSSNTVFEETFSGTGTLAGTTPDTVDNGNTWTQGGSAVYTMGSGVCYNAGTAQVLGDCTIDAGSTTVRITAETIAGGSSTGINGDFMHGIVINRNGSEFERIVINSSSTIYHQHYNAGYQVNAALRTITALTADDTLTWNVFKDSTYTFFSLQVNGSTVYSRSLTNQMSTNRVGVFMRNGGFSSSTGPRFDSFLCETAAAAAGDEVVTGGNSADTVSGVESSITLSTGSLPSGPTVLGQMDFRDGAKNGSWADNGFGLIWDMNNATDYSTWQSYIGNTAGVYKVYTAGTTTLLYALTWSGDAQWATNKRRYGSTNVAFDGTVPSNGTAVDIVHIKL